MTESENKLLKDKDIQLFIGSLLRWGVLLSMAVVILGGIIYIYRHGQTTIDYATFTGEPYFTRNIKAMMIAVFAFKGRAIIQLGILLLIATPIARVLFSAIGFVLEKDYLYVGITLVVLAIIIVSMLGGFGG
jgi:uncharacterized membrane protein